MRQKTKSSYPSFTSYLMQIVLAVKFKLQEVKKKHGKD